ncbi:unnamed protein product, partial [Didymodactylos carnosus]
EATITATTICYDRNWNRIGVTIAGSAIGNYGSSLKYLFYPIDIALDNFSNIYISDSGNNRIVKWSQNSLEGQLIIGNINGAAGNLPNQLNYPTGIYLDKINQNLYVVDSGNYRIQKFSLNTTEIPPFNGITILDQNSVFNAINSSGSSFSTVYYDNMNNNLYVTDTGNGQILLFKNDSTIRVVAGGKEGNTKLYYPFGFYVDRNLTIYIADRGNDRIVKWLKNANEGIVIAGDNGKGSNPDQLFAPTDVYVDETDDDTIYIADSNNNRIQQWLSNATDGRTIAGNEHGTAVWYSTGFRWPYKIKFDQQYSLYVTDYQNHRIQKFNLIQNGYGCH